MIYEFTSLISFLLLGIIILGASFYYNQLRRSLPQKYGTANVQKLVARAELWDSLVRTVIILLLGTRIITFFLAPIEILKVNLPDDHFILYLIAGFFFSNIWFVFLILYFFKKEIKTESRLRYQISLILFTIFVAVTDFFLSALLFIKGYFSVFQRHIEKVSMFTIHDIQVQNPLLVFLFILMILQVTLFILFFVRRSLNHVHQYWLSLLLYVVILIFYMFNIGLYMIGWQESSMIKLQLFSLYYGYWGWIFLFFFSMLIVSNLIGFMLLKFRSIMTNPQRARNLLSPLLKLGFIGLWGTSVLCVTPHILILFY